MTLFVSQNESSDRLLGTLNDILNKVSLWNNLPKEELIERLREL